MFRQVVNKGFDPPTPNAVIAEGRMRRPCCILPACGGQHEGFYMDVSTTSPFTIIVNQITTGLGATGI